MSSLEERREARRRRRQQEEDETGTLSRSAISDIVDARLHQRRLERQRRKEEAASVNGGEDDLERRRRERREARLRAEAAPAEEETTSRRSRRNRGGDDEAPAEEYTSTRSRRRRGGDEEEAPAPAPAPAEEEQTEEPAPAVEEDDSAAREAEEAERRRQEEEEEERRRQQEELRQRQEEERRRAEEQRREEERRRKEADPGPRSVRITASSPPHSRPSSLTSLPPDYTGGAGGGGGGGGVGGRTPTPSSRSTYGGLPNTGRSALSECVYNYASDDAISDLVSENQRLLEISSDCDLGSSFDEYVFGEQDSANAALGLTPVWGRGGGGRRSRGAREVSPLAANPSRGAYGGLGGGGNSVDGLSPRAAEDSLASSQDEEEEHFVPLSSEHHGSVVEGDRATRDLHAYRALKRPGDASHVPTEDFMDSSPRKARKGGSVSSSDSSFSRQDSGGFAYAEVKTVHSPPPVKQTKRVTPFAYLSSGCETPVSDREDLQDSSFEQQQPPVRFTSTTPAARTVQPESPSTSSSSSPLTVARPFHSPVHAKFYLPGHRLSVTSPVEVHNRPVHQRSVSSPANTSAGRHQDISSRMSELQRQLHGREGSTEDLDHFSSPIRKMRSQDDLRISHSQARAQITDLIGQLSSRLKKREEKTGDGDSEDLTSSSSSSSSTPVEVRRHSEPFLHSSTRQRVGDSPRVVSYREERSLLHDDSLLEEDEESFVEDEVTSDASVTDQDVSREEGDVDSPGARVMDSAQHAVHGGPRNPVPMHAAPSTAATTPALTRPRSGLPHSRGGRPDKIKEELRLCLDFLDDPAEGPDSEEEEEVSGQAVGQNLSVVPDEEYLDSSSCSSSYDSPPAEYTETDDFAEDEASYAQGVSAYFSEDSFSQAHVPDFGSAWDRDRAASMPDISGREAGPFMTKLLQYAMVHPVSPPPRVARSPSVGSPASGSSPASAVSTASSIYSPSPPPATALTPPAPSPSPPPPPPPPPPEGKSLWLQHQPVPKPFAPPPPLSTSLAPSMFTTGGSSYRVLDKKRGGGSGNSTAPTVGKKEEVDLHALLCQEILQLGLGKSGNESLPGSTIYTGSPLIGKGGVFVEHLIRPSSVKSGRNTRDWGSGDSKNSIKRLGASEPIISSFEFQEVPPKKTTIFKSELNVIPKRKMAPAESPGGCSLLSFWQKKEESSSKENLPSPSSWPTKPRPFGASKSSGELKTMLPSTSVTQKKEALISAFQNVAAKKAEPQVADTKTMKGSAEQRPGVWNSVSKPSTHPVPLAHEGETVTVEDKPKVPPPTLPKSSSMKSLQLPRSFLPQKPPAVFTPARNSGSRLSSSSSVDSDVFTTNTGPLNSEPRRLSTHEAEQNSPADSSREVGRRFPFMDPARLGGGSSLQERFPTLDLDRTDGDSSQDPEPSPSRTLAQNLALLRKDSLVAGLQDKVGLSQPQWSSKAQETVPVPASQDSNMNRVTQVSEKDAAHEMASSMSPSGSDSDVSKKRAAPRPRFDARRLTQEAKVVWKCSEESKTDYRPEMLSTTVNSKPNPEKTPKVHEVSKANPAKEHPSFMEKDVPETHKSEYKSWAADFLKDRILISESTEKHSARGIPPTQETIYEPKATPTSNGDNTSYHAETLFLPPKKPPPVHTKPMSISERISLLSKVQSPKSSTSSMSDLKPGSISDRDGPDDMLRIKPKTQVPTKEQKFASLLQNKLSNIIAEDEESSRREREREKAKRAQSRKITPAEEGYHGAGV